MKNILITGGAGFIGSNFIRHLLAKPQPVQIINIDYLGYGGSKENLADLPDADRHHFIEGNICDRPLIDKLLRQYQIDAIVHFAAESHVDRSITSPKSFIESNVVGTLSLLEAARQYWLIDQQRNPNSCRFHHISTDEVYGSLQPGDAAFTEQSRYLPNSPYSASKASSDHLVRAWHQTYALPVTLSHCSNNYGPYQYQEKFIPTIITACLEGKPIPIYGDGNYSRDWLYVNDHCSAIDAILQQGAIGEAYHIGADNEWSNVDLVKKICQLLDEVRPNGTSYQQQIEFVTDRPGHDRRYATNFDKITSELNWQPQEDFATGLMKTIQFYIGQL
ncbi:MAG: dTDP-glucose 4,6-dehydratase [Gammaproteobacteria bacterium]|nr:dTDP-glucose 4,6-dehydratase [Gammaproteobacteria bacterium]MCP4474937.1 dTDP-glucose 4,6-dehydratase [Gammaproteobacteria bacterium]